MRRGTPHPYYVDATNVHELGDMAFVFLCLDKSEPKKPIIAHLESCGIPFVDVGMGINLIDGALQGQLRVIDQHQSAAQSPCATRFASGRQRSR